MKLSVRLLPLLLAGLTLPVSQLLFQGCATLIDGPKENIRMQSRPEGAQVFLNGRAVGKTPTTVVVSRWGSHRVRIEMPGYKPFDVPLEKRFNDNASGNMFIGGVWIVVDAMTGSIFRLDLPDKARGELFPANVSTGMAIKDNGLQTGLTIAVALKPEPMGRKIGQLERR